MNRREFCAEADRIGIRHFSPLNPATQVHAVGLSLPSGEIEFAPHSSQMTSAPIAILAAKVEGGHFTHSASSTDPRSIVVVPGGHNEQS